MRDRLEPALRIACVILAALLLYHLVRDLVRSRPLANVTIPALPSLSADTNAPASAAPTKGANPTPDLARKGTNAPARGADKAATNSVASAPTNSVVIIATSKITPNVSPEAANAKPEATVIKPGEPN